MSSAFAALLSKLPTEQQAALLGQAEEAMEQALDSCFPNRQPAPQPLAPDSSNRGPNDATTETTTTCHEIETPIPRPLTNNERKRRQRQAAQLSRKMKKATRKQNRLAA